MELTIFFKGIIIGFAMAVPIGPIGVMCIRKTLTEGKLQGLMIGLGAATADLIYACVAAFGLTIISSALDSQKIWIRLGGAIFLFFIGIKTFSSKPDDSNIPVSNDGNFRSYITTVFLTLTNPITIFAFIGVFTAFSLGSGLNYFSATALVLGVLIGSFLWFLLLSSVAILFRKKLNLNGLRWVNKIAGILIIISGVIALVSLL